MLQDDYHYYIYEYHYYCIRCFCKLADTAFSQKMKIMKMPFYQLIINIFLQALSMSKIADPEY